MHRMDRFLNFIRYIGDEYLGNIFKITEFTMILLYYITFMVFFAQNMIPTELYTIIGQIQGFLALYAAYRFRFFGFAIVVSFEVVQAAFIVSRLIYEPNLSLVAGVVSKILTIISMIIVALLSNKQELQKRDLRRLAITDDLTDVYNQRYFNASIFNELEKSKKKRKSLGLILIDVDNFKKYNDIYGHEMGDEVLKSTASLIKVAAGSENLVFRYGGDEFAVLLPNSDQFNTTRVADNIRREFESQRHFCYTDGIGSQISLSMGISQYPDLATNRDELMNQADMALYHSKNLGKNKIHFYQDVISRIRKGISKDHQHLIGVFKTLLSTISAKDTYTLGHSERVSTYAVMLGEALNLGLNEISILQYAGLLHDIGKIEIPKTVLNKSSSLTCEEFELVKMHPVYSANILESLADIDQLVDFVKHHHEKYNGTGYPSGLYGSHISLGARILCIADSFDAMISERPYCSAMSADEALEELERCAGQHFDPELVEIFSSIMKAKV
ncbi:diguanylate cyclase [Pseudobacteroides cellulosolvens]|uniref:Diguanylate cyclase and metal dependent phosphohydrolase n=1 Tax=Pseudobacteroides cellulosolvens ATCC 35603 = DSM 2933 TaxID=398512 RepID=A0A0L6JTN3_9FIRM|nr:diguanylate cyclase [Pseudobacteroides cellulosolvens]KNY28767.1 diguanylate cyclase and metal dependent phosphohydrolase [Pseudobacteroides cellulosolvens ATCC 35603 = DSM 2933]